MDNDEIVERLKAMIAELDMLADELRWREAGMPNLVDMEWPVRARNAFKKEGIVSLRQLTKLAPEDLLRIPNMGKLTLQQIQDNLASVGLSLAPSRPRQYCWFPRARYG
jgi:DNA-directed RNA polymerase alpha subunit